MTRSTILAIALLALSSASPALSKRAPAKPAAVDFAVGPQYDSTHVYVAPADFDRFVTSFVATFGGTTSKRGEFQVTPTASKTMSQVVLSPVEIVSVFGFTTPVPYPFGSERTGYLVSNIDAAVIAARRAGAVRLVDTFADPIGRDVLLQWPGGVSMQFYWHNVAPNYAPLATVPDNRVYLTPDAADRFVASWLRFSRGKIVSDTRAAPGDEIGKPGTTYRRVRLVSGYGTMVVLVSNGALLWPYGRELTGYAVADLPGTLAKASAAGVEQLVAPHLEGGRQSAIVRFPGGYIAEIHSAS